MNLIYIHTNVVNDRDVADTLRGMDCRLKEFTASLDDRGQEHECAALLTAAIEEHRAEAVMSLRYFPLVSIVCNVMKVKYVSWVCESYDRGIYSSTLLNDCNRIFLTDYALYQEFVAGDFPHLAYLPLAANAERIERVFAESGIPQEEVDVTMIQDIVPKENAPYHPLSPNSPLKDATKGYMEGCIACYRQLPGLPSMTQQLPPYAWEDLRANFPPELASDSVETEVHYYDSRYFNPLITWADRETHLKALAHNRYVNTVELYNSMEVRLTINIDCRNRTDHEMQLPLAIRRGKINYVVADRNLKSGIPQIAWDIMAAGGFLLTSFQEDYLRLFPQCPPVMYIGEIQLLDKCTYYLCHEEERRELAEKLQELVTNSHTYHCRLKTILESL